MHSKHMTFIVTQFPAFASNILDSQVYSKAKILFELGWKCQFIGSDILGKCTDDNIEKFRQKYSFADIKIFPAYPKRSNFFSFRHMLRDIRSDVIKSLEKWGPKWVYFRNIFEFNTFQKDIVLRKGRCVFDVRASLSNEVRHKNKGLKGEIAELYILNKERSVFRRADHLLCVSDQMKKWISRVSGRDDATVIPCCADHDKFFPDNNMRLKLRAQLGWDKNSLAIVYVGGSSYWQRPYDIVQVLEKIKTKIPQLKVLVLTGAVEFYQNLFLQKKIFSSDVSIFSVKHEDVGGWLNVADAGIILRHNILLNNVASPIKIGEYLATGLPVICTKGIGDYSQKIFSFGAGVVIDEPFDCKNVVDLLLSSSKIEKYKKNAFKLSLIYSKEIEKNKFKNFISTLPCSQNF